jgi:hypothetical protein
LGDCLFPPSWWRRGHNSSSSCEWLLGWLG